MEWLRTCPVPIYTTEPFLANSNAVVFPFDYFADKYRGYVACTFASQIILAFDEGFDELAIFGLSLLQGTQRECTFEASNVAYWLGYVEGRGMKLDIHVPSCPLLLYHPFVYGKDYWEESEWVKDYLSTFNQRPVAI